MSRFVRASKVRHVFAQPDKGEDQYLDLRLSTGTGDHNYIKASGDGVWRLFYVTQVWRAGRAGLAGRCWVAPGAHCLFSAPTASSVCRAALPIHRPRS